MNFNPGYKVLGATGGKCSIIFTWASSAKALGGRAGTQASSESREEFRMQRMKRMGEGMCVAFQTGGLTYPHTALTCDAWEVRWEITGCKIEN